ncbi:actin-histidine N-methyltransferase-like isoform X2 [Corticium candelabrum]|uniref:actin-histidine N-methyltransferase-like isoform X2 n=1 Tax=Corticium candelabrum TaxID=121492 RepID=UPI002E26C1AA|nr:actin-histidine N-methyltransferase-like isoform X2 [Corticium candelabrum]
MMTSRSFVFMISSFRVLFLVVGIESRNFNGFMEWLQDEGGHLSGDVTIEECGEMEFGIKCVNGLDKGHRVAHISLSSLINIEHAVTSATAGPVLDELSYLTDTNAMALFVAYERQRGDSRWQPFLNIMPTRFATSLFMTKSDEEELKGSTFLEFASRRNNAVDKVYRRLSQHLMDMFPHFFPSLTRGDFLWGLSVLWSRTHRVGVRDHEGNWQHVPCLVPVADMFNMAANEDDVNIECKTNDESTHFECYTTKPVSNNSQLLVMYATDPMQRHNGRLFMDYGFVLEDNPYDSVTVEMPKIDADDKDAKLRATVLAWIPAVASSVLHMPRLNSSSVMTSELMTVMRCLTMRKESLQEIIKARSIEPSSHQDIKRINQLPPPDELQALTKAISHLHTALNKYTITVEEDKEILLEKKGSSGCTHFPLFFDQHRACCHISHCRTHPQ